MQIRWFGTISANIYSYSPFIYFILERPKQVTDEAEGGTEDKTDGQQNVDGKTEPEDNTRVGTEDKTVKEEKIEEKPVPNDNTEVDDIASQLEKACVVGPGMTDGDLVKVEVQITSDKETEKIIRFEKGREPDAATNDGRIIDEARDNDRADDKNAHDAVTMNGIVNGDAKEEEIEGKKLNEDDADDVGKKVTDSDGKEKGGKIKGGKARSEAEGLEKSKSEVKMEDDVSENKNK